jgi:hypothetical protein
MRSRDRTRIRLLRLCSVFEPPPSALVGKGVRFDPIGCSFQTVSRRTAFTSSHRE